MVGVSAPLRHEAPTKCLRLLIGLGIGLLAASGVLAAAATSAIAAATRITGSTVNVSIAAAAIGILGLLDMADRTPHTWRQVPQLNLTGEFPALRVGLVWGFDLGLVFTTQKATSLLWAGMIFASTSVSPFGVAALLLAHASVFWVRVATGNLGGTLNRMRERGTTDPVLLNRSRRRNRAGSGSFLLLVALLLASPLSIGAA